MITILPIFANFWQMAFFSKANVMIKFGQKLAVVLAKKPMFLQFFSAKIFSKS
jgi:hypothetical protein